MGFRRYMDRVDYYLFLRREDVRSLNDSATDCPETCKIGSQNSKLTII